MRAALSIEWMKFRRSAIARFATALAAVGTAALAMGFVALARSNLVSGPSREKFAVALVGTLGEAHVALAAQILPVVMLLGGGLLAVWSYGREFVEGTIGALFALPISRAATGLAKAVLLLGWSVATALVATLLTLCASAMFRWAPIDAHILRQSLAVFGAGAVMGSLGLPFGLIAVCTRGYFGAFAALLLAIAASQVLASIGWGHWVPFVAPALWAGAGGPDAAASVRPIHLLAAAGFALVGSLATVARFRRVLLA